MKLHAKLTRKISSSFKFKVFKQQTTTHTLLKKKKKNCKKVTLFNVKLVAALYSIDCIAIYTKENQVETRVVLMKVEIA